MNEYKPAESPEDLPRLFLERANSQDVEGVVALYAPEAVLVTGKRSCGWNVGHSNVLSKLAPECPGL